MARRGFGGMTALRAALGAATGVAEGLQERDILAAQRKKEEAAFERQKQLDAQSLALQLAGLQAQGWSAPEDLASQRTEARGAIGSLVGSALQAASGGVPTGGPSAAGMSALQSGFATAPEPTRKISLGGRELVLRETAPERQERLASTQAVQERTAKEEASRAAQQQLVATAEGLMKSYPGLAFEQALYAARMGKDPVDLNMAERRMSAAERERLGLDRARFGLERERFEFEKGKPRPEAAKSDAALKSMQSVLPTVVKAAETVNKWGERELKGLSTWGVNAAMNAATSAGTTGGMLMAGVLNRTASSNLDREYARIARAVGDAVARASEVGVLTNQDIARYQNQVAMVAGESEADKRAKLNALKDWANWLASNRQAISSGGAVTPPPAESQGTSLQNMRNQGARPPVSDALARIRGNK